MNRRLLQSRLSAAVVALCLSALAILPAGAASGRGTAPALANPALLQGLDPAQRTALAHNGFVVTAPTPMRDTRNLEQHEEWRNTDAQHAVYWQYYDLYFENYMHGMPNLITSDAVLHTFHVMYDQTLVAFERALLAGRLERLSAGLTAAVLQEYRTAASPALKEAARRDLGYAAVAARLLEPRAAIPAPVAGPVAQELALIAAHQGFATSPLMGYGVDYSKFVPRGHYTGSVPLRRYFQAMSWYGLLTFHLDGPDAMLRTRQALLLVHALDATPGLMALWSGIFDPITAWVGPSDDLTVRNYATVMARVYGPQTPSSALSSDTRLARFIAQARELPGPQINGEFLLPGQNVAMVGKGLRLFGQRFVPDAAIMQGLIYDKVGTRQHPRVWPSGLDVAATLGSGKATSLLSGPLGQARYAHYTDRLDALRATYQRLPAAAWSGTMYWAWLDTLRAVWAVPPAAAPAFMQTGAWADKSLATGLSSWAELRHDTILYVKQPGGFGGGAGATPPTVAYVEPVPLVYQRLLGLTLQLKATLLRVGALDALPHAGPDDISGYTYFQPQPPKGERGYRAAIDAFAAVVALLQRVAERELLGKPVAHADMQALIGIYGPLGILTGFFQDNGTPNMLPVDKQVAAIADVFTEPMSGQVLEEAVGDVLPLYAVVTVNGRRWLARGGAYSYYEFHQPMSNRLTDDAWRRLERRPTLPSWTASYMRY